MKHAIVRFTEPVHLEAGESICFNAGGESIHITATNPMNVVGACRVWDRWRFIRYKKKPGKPSLFQR